ncbi:acyl carrier protein [Curvibacter gracilis]|uniref:acyl carrier protein n=1 Tax=Curvibacter gracilis TaxID=230310 RepID=UPI000484E710|nr:acyl carrier protein [Curvibacter gracilis]
MNIEHTVQQILMDKFHVEGALIKPSATLQDLGLDSLSLMEFVFALEDAFQVRIPEERVESARERLTLDELSTVIREHLDRPAAAQGA